MMMMTQFDKQKFLSVWLLLLLGICLALSSADAQTSTTTKRTTAATTTTTTTTTTTAKTTAKPQTPEQQAAICQLPLDPGPCRMRLERFYYNPKTNTCESFKFGGCRGNDNKFGFRQTCEEACLVATPKAKATK